MDYPALWDDNVGAREEVILGTLPLVGGDQALVPGWCKEQVKQLHFMKYSVFYTCCNYPMHFIYLQDKFCIESEGMKMNI